MSDAYPESTDANALITEVMELLPRLRRLAAHNRLAQDTAQRLHDDAASAYRTRNLSALQDNARALRELARELRQQEAQPGQ